KVQQSEMIYEKKLRNQETEIAYSINDEGFLAGRCGGIAQEKESDEQIRRQSHAFPADKHRQIIVRKHQRQHEEHEKIQVGEEPVKSILFPHVADGVNVNEEANSGHNQKHDQRKLI